MCLFCWFRLRALVQLWDMVCSLMHRPDAISRCWLSCKMASGCKVARIKGVPTGKTYEVRLSKIDNRCPSADIEICTRKWFWGMAEIDRQREQHDPCVCTFEANHGSQTLEPYTQRIKALVTALLGFQKKQLRMCRFWYTAYPVPQPLSNHCFFLVPWAQWSLEREFHCISCWNWQGFTICACVYET